MLSPALDAVKRTAPPAAWLTGSSAVSQALNPQGCAERATLKALLNCYMRDICAGTILRADDRSTPMQIELALPQSAVRLRVEVTYWSLAGPHDFGALTLYDAGTGVWRSAHPAQVITTLLMECEARAAGADSGRMLELMRRVLNSYDQIARLCADGRAPRAEFLSAEQGLYFGHWLHPTPKSREGMTEWQQAAYAPEVGGTFQLHYFAADRSLVAAGSADGRTVHERLADIPDLALDDLGPDETAIPMHPLQAQAVCLRPAVRTLLASGRLRDLGLRGPAFSATSSVRTVYAQECPWMLKFSIPVKITNSLRVNLQHELEAGVIMARLLRKIGPLPSQFQIINDPAFVTLRLPEQDETGFEVIFRENPFMDQNGAGIVTVAALTADPLPGRQSLLSQSVMAVSRRENALPSTIAKRWFGAYLDCALRPALALYDQWGIALEAHQQNSLLDIGNGLPSRAFFRDNQGYYIAETLQDALAEKEPDLRRVKSLCFPEAEINARYCYYLIVNQVFSVISRLGRDGLADEGLLVTQLRRCLQEVGAEATGPAAGFVRFLLSADHLHAKSNLLTRLHDVDELEAEGEKAVYVRLPNPLVMSVAEACHVPA